MKVKDFLRIFNKEENKHYLDCEITFCTPDGINRNVLENFEINNIYKKTRTGEFYDKEEKPVIVFSEESLPKEYWYNKFENIK